MPTIAYPGGKARLANKIISFLPQQGRIYVEPFAGRGNLFWAAVERGLKFRQWWLNDIATAPFFEAIKNLGDKIEVPPRSRAEFERYREAHKSGDLAVCCFPRTSVSLAVSTTQDSRAVADSEPGAVASPALDTNALCASAIGYSHAHAQR